MNNIKNIQVVNNKFIVDLEKSSLKLDCQENINNFVVDISHMNLIEATKTAIFCSTFCFIKNFSKNLCWIVADEETKNAISILRLKNVEQIVKEKVREERIALVS